MGSRRWVPIRFVVGVCGYLRTSFSLGHPGLLHFGATIVCTLSSDMPLMVEY